MALGLAGVFFAPLSCVEDSEHPFPATGGRGSDDTGGSSTGGKASAAGGRNSGTGAAGATGATSSGGTSSGGSAPAAGKGGSGGAGTGGSSKGGAPATGGAGGSKAATSGGTSAGAPPNAEGGMGGDPGGGEGGAAEPPGDEIPAGYVKGIVAVGYGGLRVVSRDDGKTWGDAVDFGDANEDDENLLRAVTYGKGRWIATGWRLIYSDDGVNWTQHSMVRDEFENQQIIEGLAYKDGYFYGAGDPGRFYRSADGLDWEPYGERIGDTEKHTALAYRGGVFVSYGDSSTSFRSADGLAWEQMNVEKATYCEGAWKTLSQCHDAAWFDGGFYLRVEWGGTIQRSETGSNFQQVYRDPDEHTAYKTITFAQGYVAP
jgi:hypothetical protein